MKIRIANIINDSIVDGPGIRLTVFVQGCVHSCHNCHNPSTHDLNGGELIDTDEIIEMLSDNPLLDGITFSGGEPLLYAEELSKIAEKAKEMNLNVIVYTGYLWEEIMESFSKYAPLINKTDYVIDGVFVENLKSLEIKFRGSKNQRIINVQESLKNGKCIGEDWD